MFQLTWATMRQLLAREPLLKRVSERSQLYARDSATTRSVSQLSSRWLTLLLNIIMSNCRVIFPDFRPRVGKKKVELFGHHIDTLRGFNTGGSIFGGRAALRAAGPIGWM